MSGTQIQLRSLAPWSSIWHRFVHGIGFSAFPLEELRHKYENEHSRYIDVDGTRVHYRIEGSGPPLLLLHGVLAQLQTWDGWVDRLKHHYTVVRVDLPGFGLTGPMVEGEYTPEFAMHFFEKTRQKLGFDRFHLAGNSLGGFIAWYYATHHPERVDKLVLLDPLSYPFKAPWIMRMVSLPLIGEITRTFAPRFIVEQNVYDVYGDHTLVNDDIVNRYYELLMREGNRSAMVEYFRAAGRFFSREMPGHYSERIPTVQAPTLLMWGEKDRWIPPKLVDRWKRDLPSVQVQTYPGVGHIPMEEIPDRSATDAYEFLRR